MDADKARRLDAYVRFYHEQRRQVMGVGYFATKQQDSGGLLEVNSAARWAHDQVEALDREAAKRAPDPDAPTHRAAVIAKAARRLGVKVTAEDEARLRERLAANVEGEGFLVPAVGIDAPRTIEERTVVPCDECGEPCKGPAAMSGRLGLRWCSWCSEACARKAHGRVGSLADACAVPWVPFDPWPDDVDVALSASSFTGGRTLADALTDDVPEAERCHFDADGALRPGWVDDAPAPDACTCPTSVLVASGCPRARGAERCVEAP